MDPTESKRQKMNDDVAADNPEGNNLEENPQGEFLTLQEHFEANQADEELRTAVTGASDPDKCSYEDGGYMGRQALYACADCCDLENNPAGFCHACSVYCHSECENVYELWTKRNFRCDCGNKKFKKKCELDEYKDDVNPDNKYNHNFKGLYCTCARPYPDPEKEEESEMIQCVVCEDWLHVDCIGSNQPPEDQGYEFICPKCTENLDFLVRYKPLAFVGNAAVDLDKVEKNRFFCGVTKCDGDKPEAVGVKDTSKSCNPESSIPKDHFNNVSKNNSPSSIVSESSSANTSKGSTKSDEVSGEVPSVGDDPKGDVLESATAETSKETSCDKPASSSGSDFAGFNGGSFWPSGWRQYLCSCDKCQEKYKNLNVSFIRSNEDTVGFYEDKGKKDKEDHDQRFFSGLPRSGQNAVIDGLLKYRQMMKAIYESLAQQSQGGVVTQEHVDEAVRSSNNS